MFPPSVSGLAAVVSGTWLAAAADTVNTTGPDFKGIAAIIAASAGMFSAITALILGLRTKKPEVDPEKELYRELLLEQLKKNKEAEDDDPDQ